MIPIDPNSKLPWTPPHLMHLPEAERPVYFFRPMTARRSIELLRQSTAVAEDGRVSWKGEDAFALVASALCDWGGAITAAFPGSEAAVEWLDLPTLRAAAEHVLGMTRLGDVTRKNSESAPPLSVAPSSTSDAEGPNAPAS